MDEQEQQGSPRAGYGEQLLKRLSRDLSNRFGCGFSERNLEQMRGFYLGWPISQAMPAKSLPSPDSGRQVDISKASPALLAVKNAHARAFYEREALRGGWTSRQLDRQIQSQFYERTALSRDKVAMLRKGASATAEDTVNPEEEIKIPTYSSSWISRTSTRRAIWRPH